MNIQLTRQAELKLKDKLGDKPGAIRLIYDTEGCGCAVNGVPSLRIVDEPTTEDIAVETGSTVPFIVNRKQAVFRREDEAGRRSSHLLLPAGQRGQNYGTNIQVLDARA